MNFIGKTNVIDVCYGLNTAMFLLALALVKPLGQSIEHWIIFQFKGPGFEPWCGHFSSSII